MFVLWSVMIDSKFVVRFLAAIDLTELTISELARVQKSLLAGEGSTRSLCAAKLAEALRLA